MNPGYLAMHLKVLDKKWTVYFCTKKYFEQTHKRDLEEEPNKTVAFCVLDDKKMYFRMGGMKRETISHELTHAYLWELCLWDLYRSEHSREKMDRMEEVFCDIFAKYGKTMLQQVDQIQSASSLLRSRAKI